MAPRNRRLTVKALLRGFTPSLECPNGVISQLHQAIFMRAMEMEDVARARRESVMARLSFSSLIASKEVHNFFDRAMTDLQAAQALSDYDVIRFKRLCQQSATGYAEADAPAAALVMLQKAMVKSPDFLAGMISEAADLREILGRPPASP